MNREQEEDSGVQLSTLHSQRPFPAVCPTHPSRFSRLGFLTFPHFPFPQTPKQEITRIPQTTLAVFPQKALLSSLSATLRRGITVTPLNY